MPEALNRSQRRIVADVMSVVASDGFVMAGGVALIVAGVSTRPTHDLAAFSATCDDVENAADQLIERLHASGYLVEAHHSDPTFARMTVSTGKYRRTVLVPELGRDHQLFSRDPFVEMVTRTMLVRDDLWPE